MKATIVRRTPPAFRPAVTQASVAMLPLVDDPDRPWSAGWCTYTDGFDANPDIEVFCGGENEKSATAAACWRQGNLFHFGFEQSPAQLNESGQRLLLNSVAYISRFTEDRPIAVTPSVFAGPVGLPRTYLDRRLERDGKVDECGGILAGRWMDALRGRSPDEVRRWFREHRSYLHPGADQKLTVDEEALELQAPIDRIDFFDRAMVALSGDEKSRQTAGRLLERYGPAEGGGRRTAGDWAAWLKEHRPYLFFSDQGDYRWYVDPLAKKRGIPSDRLRGPSRASR